MKIIGTKFCGHDSALCFIDTKKQNIFALSTERVTRIKHDSMDITPILETYQFPNLDCVAHSYSDFDDKGKDGELRKKMTITKDIEKTLRKIIEPKYIKDLSISRREKNSKIFKALFTKPGLFFSYYFHKYRRALTYESPKINRSAYVKYIRNCFSKNSITVNEIVFYDHHLCHAAPSYYLSPFSDEPAIALTIDGQGDGYFSKAFLFEKQDYKLIGSSKATYLGTSNWYKSIGRIYNYFTEAMDLRPNSDEGKVEALAAYGNADKEMLNDLKAATFINTEILGIDFHEDKLVKFYDTDYLKKCRLKVGDENFCATVQTYLEDTIVDYLNAISDIHPLKKLCLSGGVAANIIMSLNIYERTNFKEIYVLPPMGDDGLAIGSAILAALEHRQDLSWLQNYKMPYFGDSYGKKEVLETLKKFESIQYIDLGESWPDEAAKSVAKGNVCAFFQGKMEYGPRALGNRSIVASPIIKESRDKINSNIKKRPSYQPFCPSILEEERSRLFGKSFSHKHMAIAFRMKKKHAKSLPCAIHIDGTARPQFVEEKDNPTYYRYLKKLKEISGYGVSLNTSFNLHGRTIVRTPTDAIEDFIDCHLDELYIEGYKVVRV